MNALERRWPACPLWPLSSLIYSNSSLSFQARWFSGLATAYRGFHLWSSILPKKCVFGHAEKSSNLLSHGQSKDIGTLLLPAHGRWWSQTWTLSGVVYFLWSNGTDSFKFCTSRPKTESWESIIMTAPSLCTATTFSSRSVGERISWCLRLEKCELWSHHTAFSSLIKRKSASSQTYFLIESADPT